MIKEYSEIGEHPDVQAWDCMDISVHTMWSYYASIDTNEDRCLDRITEVRGWFSVWTPWGQIQVPEPSRCLDKWGELGSKVKRGYYVGLRNPDDPQAIHSTFFIKWEQPPVEDNGDLAIDPGECTATFKAIGGNQSGEPPRRVGVNTLTICNGTKVACNCSSEYTWNTTSSTTFFGKTWHPSKAEDDGG